jgi:hypothetical protein
VTRSFGGGGKEEEEEEEKEEGAVGGVAGDDGFDPVVVCGSAFERVETAVAFAGIFVEAVAAEAGVCEDGADVAVVLRLIRQGSVCGGEGGGEGDEAEGEQRSLGWHRWRTGAGRGEFQGEGRKRGLGGVREKDAGWLGEERKAFSIAGGMLSLARSMIGESNRQREEGPSGGLGTGVSWERLAEEAEGDLSPPSPAG